MNLNRRTPRVKHENKILLRLRLRLHLHLRVAIPARHEGNIFHRPYFAGNHLVCSASTVGGKRNDRGPRGPLPFLRPRSRSLSHSLSRCHTRRPHRPQVLPLPHGSSLGYCPGKVGGRSCSCWVLMQCEPPARLHGEVSAGGCTVAASGSSRPAACMGAEGCGGRRGILDIMRGRSRMAIDPGILTMPGRSMSGFRRPDRHCLHQGRRTVKCPASRTKSELHPPKNRL